MKLNGIYDFQFFKKNYRVKMDFRFQDFVRILLEAMVVDFRDGRLRSGAPFF